MTVADKAPGTLVIRRVIPASREEIFDAWTDAASVGRWICPGQATYTTAELDVRVGGRWAEGDCGLRIAECGLRIADVPRGD